MTKPWFRRWFGEHYKQLYPHRGLQEAEGQVIPLLKALHVTSEWRVLDIGCGSGRHLEVLKARGIKACAGMDLSLPLLRDARARALPVARADMRHPPFRRGGFDLVTSFFTSFGYFATFEEDVDALAQFVSALKPGGYLFLDLINAPNLIRTLVPFDSREVNGNRVEQRRRVEADSREGRRGQVVVKEIAIRHPSGETERYEERVRLYGLEEMIAIGTRFGLRHLATFGDETGGAWLPATSPRMAMLFQSERAPRGGGPAPADGAG